jgi:hypothetical protein
MSDILEFFKKGFSTASTTKLKGAALLRRPATEVSDFNRRVRAYGLFWT